MESQKFVFHEHFSAFDEKNCPYGLFIEENSVYTHRHVRVEDKVFYITCRGNNYLLRTPELFTFDADISLGFHNTEGDSSFRIVFGYDRKLRTGYAVDFHFGYAGGIRVVMSQLNRLRLTEISETSAEYSSSNDRMDLSVSCNGERLSIQLGENHIVFDTPAEYKSGLFGVTFTGHVGELAVYDISLESPDPLDHMILCDEKTAELSLRGGGNIPYTLTYSLERFGTQTYLKYSFDGGAQYRENYPGYPRETGQYTVEKDVFYNPYIALYGKGSRIGKYTLYNGDFTTTDPGLHWQVLREYFNVVDLPLSGMIPVDIPSDLSGAEISFGYDKMIAGGYRMQTEEDIEYIFSITTGEAVYEGKSRETEHISIRSDSHETISLIPKTVYNYDEVIRHLENNHFFTDEEEIAFTVSVISKKDKRFISVRANLLDVFGDLLEEMSVGMTDDIYTVSRAALDVGVYRLQVCAYYGSDIHLERTVTFEVCDPSGRRCAPLESGLPFLYSMPNEQKYLDRDAFDLYNPVPDCNMEHYYACSSMTGDIAVKKRIWETNRLFGRKWYVWNGDHRTLTREEFDLYSEEILRQSDYCYYPTPSEWAVMRHDPVQIRTFNEGGLLKHLKEFMKIHPEYNIIGLDESWTSINQDQLSRVLSVCMGEWLVYANHAVGEEVAAQTKSLLRINPDVKRACYGPFPIYAGPITTHHSCYYSGSRLNGRSHPDDFFTGFAQLEDYPYSCAYHTYSGACFVMHTLLHNPGLCIYPEEYTSSRGGCIDGAVKDANPPLGKYDMPEYFNVTHSYEYAFNTAHLTENGFRYWNTYGFMQRDFSEEFVDAFVKGWKNVIRHKPVRPLRSTAYLSEISPYEDKWVIGDTSEWPSNRSNAGLSYMYETSRKCGIPNGYAVSYQSIMNLTSDMTDCLVLPSMRYAPAEVIEKVRSLYNSGVSLIAVGDAAGLEDIFGVEYNPHTEMICSLETADGQSELIFPDKAEFLYQPVSSCTSVLLYAVGADGTRVPAVILKDRACMISASTDQLGHRSYENDPLFTASSISPLLREVMSDVMINLSNPIAYSNNAGITLFEDEHGDTLMLVIDYSDYDLASADRTWCSDIMFHTDDITDIDVLYGNVPAKLTENGILRGISIELHQQECALFKITKK